VALAKPSSNKWLEAARKGHAALLCSALLVGDRRRVPSGPHLSTTPSAEEPAAGTTSSGFRLHAERLAGPCVRATTPSFPLSFLVLRIHSLSIRPRRDADCVHCRPDFLDCSVMFFLCCSDLLRIGKQIWSPHRSQLAC
jgi:hypothetical protein